MAYFYFCLLDFAEEYSVHRVLPPWYVVEGGELCTKSENMSGERMSFKRRTGIRSL